jgi:Flp pilus assembly protein TadD
VDQAVRWFKIAAEHAPNQPEANLKLGSALLMANRAQEAVLPLETAIRLEPQNSGAHMNLDIAYAGTGRVADART